MTVDLIDHAFLRRLADPVVSDIAVATPLPPVADGGQPPSPVQDPVVAALLATCPEQWARLADRVEAAWAAGERIIAVAGRARGDGVSTVVHGLAHVLRERGALMTCREHRAAGDRTGADSADDGRPVLVDGGAWFPSGPVHRGRLARAAFGCQAAILVRRASGRPSPAHAAALATLGVRVLGEVVTFAEAPAPAAVESA